MALVYIAAFWRSNLSAKNKFFLDANDLVLDLCLLIKLHFWRTDLPGFMGQGLKKPTAFFITYPSRGGYCVRAQRLAHLKSPQRCRQTTHRLIAINNRE